MNEQIAGASSSSPRRKQPDEGGVSLPPRGFWATLAWVFGAFIMSVFVEYWFLRVWISGHPGQPYRPTQNGGLWAARVCIEVWVQFAIIVLGIRLTNRRATKYLSLVRPSVREAAVGALFVAGYVLLFHALIYLSGGPFASPMFSQIYRSARSAGGSIMFL